MEDIPSADEVLLPSRAFLLSWREQHLAMRRFALDDAEDHFRSQDDGDHRDMALLGVIGEALQCIEDFAILATAWDSPLRGLAHYLRATQFSGRKVVNFWQEVGAWDDDRIDALAGLSVFDPDLDGYVRLETVFDTSLPADGVAIMEVARLATREHLRDALAHLARRWKEFSPYFLAYKHGGLTIGRRDLRVVDDDVEVIDESTPTHDIGLAVWRKSGKSDGVAAETTAAPEEIAHYAASAGYLALRLTEAFLATRLWNVEGLRWAADNTVAGLDIPYIPWTVWLRDEDLTSEQWAQIGIGPRVIGWSDEPPEDHDSPQ